MLRFDRLKEISRRGAGSIGAVALVLSTLTIGAGHVPTAPRGFHAPLKAALSPSEFDAGLIISDENFYDRAAMSESQIQAFLESKGSVLATYRASVSSRGTDTSWRTGNVICTPFTGGDNLLASTIIYRAQSACNISARVLLVTLQKEQSLITRSSATDAIFRKAMGYGCPDTDVCDSAYYGFGNQVYQAANQLHNYSVGRFARQPGVHTILWHPDASCGSSTFEIRNYATAALYNYTPYRPNAAALNNMPGIGDSCSSYGNRNFWYFYYTWFGSPVSVSGTAEIEAAYAASGGTSGPLGALVGARPCPVSLSACWNEYERGYIGWSRGGGAHLVTDASILASYQGRGGPGGALGVPLGPASSFATSNGDGTAQNFQGGYLYSSSAGVFLVAPNTSAASLWVTTGWIRGSLGWPIGDQRCGVQACSQEFQHGFIGRAASGSAFLVVGALADAYRAWGGNAGEMGQPLAAAAEFSVPAGDGTVLSFERGYFYSSDAGIFMVRPRTPQADVWVSEGWIRGTLGWPISEERCAAGHCVQDFQGGVISWSGSNAQSLTGPIATYYKAQGAESGPLRYPTGPANSFSTPNGTGLVQVFQGGYLYASTSGVFKVTPGTPLAAAWAASGWIRGSLGWPVTDETCGASGCVQQFQGGAITGAGTLVLEVSDPAIKDYHDAQGGISGPLGNPVGPANAFSTPSGAGLVQVFQGGYVYSSAAGVFKVVPGTALANAWAASGWIRGPLGWPVAEEVCGAAGCSQQFQGGTLTH